jgi:hypothetical protein
VSSYSSFLFTLACFSTSFFFQLPSNNSRPFSFK